MEEIKPNIDQIASLNEDRERKLFMQDLNRFMGEVGKPLSKIPIMGYKELDLFQLFKEVAAYGGFNEVVKNVGTWSKIWKRLGNFDPSITDSSFRLKKNYERYLLEYEYSSFPEHRKQAMDIDVQMKRSSSTDSFTTPSSPEEAPRISKVPKSKKSKRKTFPSPTTPKGSKGSLRTSMGTVGIPFGSGSGGLFVEREKSGSPKMPLILGGGELIVENLGKIISRPPYVTDKHIWPVGFTSSRYFSSMIHPDQRVKYTSQIVDVGDRPQFVVTAVDEPHNPIISYSPSGAWRAVLKRVMGTDDSKRNISVSGTLRFGLAHPVVSHLIRELPGGTELSNPPSPSLSLPSSPSSEGSPMPERKRKSPSRDSSSSSSSSEEEDLDQDSNIELPTTPKQQKMDSIYESKEHFSARDVQFTSREELDALESAVATLNALKHCVVF